VIDVDRAWLRTHPDGGDWLKHAGSLMAANAAMTVDG
jgi:hypothetical protein